MTNATAISAKLRDLGYLPLPVERARQWGGLSVRKSSFEGEALVSVQTDDKREIDALATAKAVEAELKEIGYRTELKGDTDYAWLYVKGNPVHCTKLLGIPYTWIVRMNDKLFWAVQTDGSDIHSVDFNDLKATNWEILGTLTHYSRPEGALFAGWVFEEAHEPSDPVPGLELALKQWKYTLVFYYKQRRDERLLKSIRELEVAIDDANARRSGWDLSQCMTKASQLWEPEFKRHRHAEKLENAAFDSYIKAKGDRREAAQARYEQYKTESRESWENCREISSLRQFAEESWHELHNEKENGR